MRSRFVGACVVALFCRFGLGFFVGFCCHLVGVVVVSACCALIGPLFCPVVDCRFIFCCFVRRLVGVIGCVPSSKLLPSMRGSGERRTCVCHRLHQLGRGDECWLRCW